MKLYEFTSVLRGNRRLYIVGEGTQPLTFADFFHKYRKTSLWTKKVESVHTVTKEDCVIYAIELQNN